MKKIILLVLLALTVGAQAQFKDHFRNKTLRIDYMHSGSAPVEYYMFDTLFVEKYSIITIIFILPNNYHQLLVF